MMPKKYEKQSIKSRACVPLNYSLKGGGGGEDKKRQFLFKLGLLLSSD
jgi:hypothetical protein